MPPAVAGYYAVLAVLLCNHLGGEERELVALLCLSSWCLATVIVLQTLPGGAVGWSAVYDCGIF